MGAQPQPTCRDDIIKPKDQEPCRSGGGKLYLPHKTLYLQSLLTFLKQVQINIAVNSSLARQLYRVHLKITQPAYLPCVPGLVS